MFRFISPGVPGFIFLRLRNVCTTLSLNAEDLFAWTLTVILLLYLTQILASLRFTFLSLVLGMLGKLPKTSRGGGVPGSRGLQLQSPGPP